MSTHPAEPAPHSKPATFSFPTTTIYRIGARHELSGWLAKLGSARPLIVTDASLTKTKAFGLLLDSLTGIKTAVFSEVQPNPHEADVEGAWQAYRENQCDAVIAFGGGSALDVGKAVRLRVKRPENALAQFEFGADWSGLAPLVAIPTTAGTGSEVGRSSVIIMEDRKHVIFHPALLASLVILDPEFTRELPPKLTAATGADAFTHCLESFTSPEFHPLCDGIALEGLHLITTALLRAVNDGNDLEARGLMQVAAAMGGIAFQKDLGATHSLAHPLSSVCGLHHGLANALCLPFVMEFNAARKPGVYRRVGIAMGLSNPTDADTIAAVRALFEEIELKPGLRAHGVEESKLDVLADQAFADSCHATNPVPVTREDLRNLYLAAL